MTISTFQKMKEQGYYRQQYFKDVECFSCPNKFKVGRSAKSTQCPACGVHICLEDIDINVASTQSILTRGDVLIRKNGNVSAGHIKCRDLKVFGMVSAQIECSGDLVFRTSGTITIIGEIRCKRLVVEKGSDIHFHNVIYAEDVDLQARVSGNIQCSGRVLIGALGWIHGDVTARSVSIEPGGQLDGAMNILRTSSSTQPLSPFAATPVASSGEAA
jgi:cytoskeletal protein CcmA (bactofilin family)